MVSMALRASSLSVLFWSPRHAALDGVSKARFTRGLTRRSIEFREVRGPLVGDVENEGFGTSLKRSPDQLGGDRGLPAPQDSEDGRVVGDTGIGIELDAVGRLRDRSDETIIEFGRCPRRCDRDGGCDPRQTVRADPGLVPCRDFRNGRDSDPPLLCASLPLA